MICVAPVDSKEYSICYDLIYMLIFALHCLNRQFESICLLELSIDFAGDEIWYWSLEC